MRHLPERKSLRRKGHGYGGAFTYFITICTHNRAQLFGHILNSRLEISPLGKLVDEEWQGTFLLRGMAPTPYVIMPNHMHAIIALGSKADYGFSDWSDQVRTLGQAGGATLGSIVGGFKAAASRKAKTLDANLGTLWQGRYHEHVIRSQAEFDRIHAYILNNPLSWQEDRFYMQEPMS